LGLSQPGKDGLYRSAVPVYRPALGTRLIQENRMADMDELLQDLKQKRDELRVKIHLASREMQDEWEELETKMDDFTRRARIKETGKNVGKALGLVGEELKSGYKRIQRALKDD
jgi:predicted RNase H-like nuclease (RuvC/YqgF family)